MISQYDIEDKAFEYLNATGVKPRFVLLDSASYEALSKQFVAKEKFELLTDSTPEPPRITHVHLHSNIIVEILEVNVKSTLFEVVG